MMSEVGTPWLPLSGVALQVFVSLNAIPSRWAQKQKDDAANKLIYAAIQKMPQVRFLDISEAEFKASLPGW